MKKITNTLINILIVLTLLVGTITIYATNVKIWTTARELVRLHDKAQHYNEAPIKTDEMTDEFIEIQAERQKIYNSEDYIVRIFSRSHTLIKAVILIYVVLTFILIPYMWFVLIVREAYKLKRKSEKRKRRNQLSKMREVSN